MFSKRNKSAQAIDLEVRVKVNIIV